MDEVWRNMKTTINRRSFVKNGLTAAGVATAGVGLLADSCVRVHGVLSFERLGRTGGELSGWPEAARVFKVAVSWLAPCWSQILRWLLP